MEISKNGIRQQQFTIYNQLKYWGFIITDGGILSYLISILLSIYSLEQRWMGPTLNEDVKFCFVVSMSYTYREKLVFAPIGQEF